MDLVYLTTNSCYVYPLFGYSFIRAIRDFLFG